MEQSRKNLLKEVVSPPQVVFEVSKTHVIPSVLSVPAAGGLICELSAACLCSAIVDSNTLKP